MRVCLLSITCSGTLHNSYTASIALHIFKVTLSCGPACKVARSLVHATSQLSRPICPLPGHNPYIKGVTINDSDVFGDVKSSPLPTLHYS